MAQFSNFDVIVHHYLHRDMDPIVQTIAGTVVTGGSGSIENGYFFDPEDVNNLMEVPPHMTFMGWYSPQTDTTQTSFHFDNETDFTQPFIVYAQWNIKTQIQLEDTVILDLNSGGVNLTPGTCGRGAIGYDANGFPIQGIIDFAEGVEF